MLKSAAIITAIIMCSCTSTQTTTPKMTYDPSNTTPPPTDMEMTLGQPKQTFPHQETTQEEEQRYMASLSDIMETMQNETLQLKMCFEVHTKDTYCNELLKSFCKIDELIDTRGHIHRKPYCQ